MKRILIALVMLATVHAAYAQKSPEAVRKTVDAAKAATENPKKNTKVATWTKLASVYMDAYDAPIGNLLINTPKIQLEQFGMYKQPLAVEQVEIEGAYFRKEIHADKALYFDESDVLRIIEVTQPVYEDALAEALAAYVKAAEVDVKGAKLNDIKAGMFQIAQKYFKEGMEHHSLGNLTKAATLVAKAAEAGATAPLSAPDTTHTYYAGLLYQMNGDNENAKVYLEKCLAMNYYEKGGNVYPNLADAYFALNQEEKAVEILEAGFVQFPENASILVGLINHYLAKEGGEEKLLALITKAKATMPNNASIYSVEGDVYKRLKDYEKAEVAYREGIAIAPNTPHPYLSLGGYFLDLGSEFFTKAQETMDDNEYMALMKEYEAMYIKSLEPLETAVSLMADDSVQPNKRDIVNTLKSVYFNLRNIAPEYMDKYNYYNDWLNK